MSVQATLSSDTRPLKDIPGPKGRFLIGNLSDFDFTQFHQYSKDQAKIYGSIYRLSFAHKPVVVLSDPDVVRSILKSRPEKYRRVSSIQSVFSELGIDGLFSAEGENWKIQRKMINQAFSPAQINNYLPIIYNATQGLLKVMDHIVSDRQKIDLQALLQRYTVDITTNLAFGYDVDSLNQQDSALLKNISVVFPMLSDRIKAPIPYWRFFKLKKDKELDLAIEFIKEQSHHFIQAAEDNIANGKEANNILEAMILARDEKGNAFNQENLFPNIITLLLAGEDTTANTLSWIIHYLIENPKYQDELYREIKSKNISYDFNDVSILDDFPFVSAVIQEAMRLMPVAPFTYLENISAENIEGYQIPAGTMIVVLLSQTGHDAKHFKEPEKFNPERWLNASDESKKRFRKDLMHFGSGARQCPGMQLSFIEMKYALINLIDRFAFSKGDNSIETRDIFAFTVMPKDLQVSISRRE